MPEVLPASSKPVGGFLPLAFFKKRILFFSIILLLILSVITLGQLSGRLSLWPKSTSIASLPPIKSAEDAQRRVGLISSRFVSPQTAPKLQQEIAEAAAIPNDFPGPGGENVRQGARYSGVFGGLLLAQYYATRDPEILSLAQQVRAFIKKEFPLFYAAGERDGIWEIKGE